MCKWTALKINAVLLRDINDNDAPELLRWCMDHDYELRFIEQMPLDAQHNWNSEAMVTAGETLTLLGESYSLTPMDGRGSAPAEKFLIDGGPHTVGIIGPVTRPFCGDCNRVRLTADRWRTAMWAKLRGHGINDTGCLQSNRTMSAIGG